MKSCDWLGPHAIILCVKGEGFLVDWNGYFLFIQYFGQWTYTFSIPFLHRYEYFVNEKGKIRHRVRLFHRELVRGTGSRIPIMFKNGDTHDLRRENILY
jgi:hypothetical protein